MMGKDAKSLEETLVTRLSQVDKTDICKWSKREKYQKNVWQYEIHISEGRTGKIRCFNEMGGKLSFSLAMLNESDNGFVLNAVHSREGCYTYIKEIIDGNSIITLAEEEQEALKMAKESTGSNPAK